MTILTNILISKSSFSGIKLKESVDLALVCAAFELQVNLIFIDHGVHALVKRQNATLIGCKNHVDLIKGLEFYDIESVYVEEESLDKYNISTDELFENIQVVSRDFIANSNIKANHLVNF